VNVQDSNGWTALMKAAYWNQVAVIKVLADRGADLNLMNSKGETAFALAKKRKSSVQAFELLKSLGAKD
jgi:ankyrin repeat protein